MALVAYEYSDSSDIEEEETIKPNVAKKDQCSVSETQNPEQIKAEPVETPQLTSFHVTGTDDSSVVTGDNLFNLLPKPTKMKAAVVEDDDEFLHKKETIIKPKAKITVPSLSDFKDVEGTVPNAKPKVTNGKKSGLLSMLPQPKHAVSVTTTTKSFVPHILTQKPAATVKKKEPLPSPAKKVKPDVKSLIKDYSDESDDDEVQNDFFSINKIDDPLPDVNIPLDTDKVKQDVINNSTGSNKMQSRDIQSYFKQDAFEEPNVSDINSVNSTEDPMSYTTQECSSSNYGSEYHTQASNSNEVTLDDEAILKLCGARGKRKREEIQIVEVNQQEVLADAREWLLKGLMDDTTKRVSVSKRRGDEPTSQQRRKHQITYLAHQAKANEAELQNQWANNRVSKRQTQSKYGF